MTELQLPAYIANRANRGIAAQLATSLPTGIVPYISIKGSRFTAFDAAGNERQVGSMNPQLGVYLDVCVVDSNPHVSKIYYARPFDPNSDIMMPPDCWSDNGVAPSVQAASPQHKDCKTCPHNQWGSDTSRLTGKGTKACNDVQKIAVVIASRPEDPWHNAVFLLRVPPASLKNLAKYIQEIGSFSAGGRKVDICDLLTRVYFDKDAVGILRFTAADWADEGTLQVADKIWESKASETIVGKLDRPYTGEVGVLPAAQPAEQRTLPPPIPQGFNPQLPPNVGIASQEEAPKKRGRPRKEPAQEAPTTYAPFAPTPAPPAYAETMQAATASAANGQDDGPEIPAFLQRTETPQAKPETPQAKPETPQAKPAPSFGMQPASPAPDDMQARIAAVLALKTGNG